MFHSKTMSALWSISRRLTQGKPLVLVVAILVLGVPARADSISTFAAPIGGFVANSALAAGATGAAYLAAQGTPTEFLSFSTDKNGNPITGSTVAVAGDVFSNLVTFSSAGSPLVDLGNGNSASSEIGPVTGFNGTLNIQFLSPVFAVAFGAVDPFTYVAFDASGNALTSGSTGANTFDFLGLVDNSGSNIASLQLNGTFYAIQDLQYAVGTVPEPNSLSLLAVGLIALIGCLGSRRIRRQASLGQTT